MADVKKVAAKKPAAKKEEGIYGYCMKTKSSNLMQDVEIRNSNNHKLNGRGSR